MTTRSILIHCNAGGAYGMGHGMRALALGEEAASRGWAVTVAGDVGSRAAASLRASIPHVRILPLPLSEAGEALSKLARAESPDVVHLDTYWGQFSALRDGPWVLSNMQDGPFGVRAADLSIDANIGAEGEFHDPKASGLQVAGGRVAAIRAAVRRLRLELDENRPATRILIVLGGTDPSGVTPRVLDALNAVRSDVTLTVINPTDSPAVRDAAARSAHPVRLVPFSSSLPELAAQHDFVITAAGTSVLDFASMGLPMAAVCVAENQIAGYRRLIAAGLAFPLSNADSPSELRGVSDLDQLLGDPLALRAMSARARTLVDGLGAWRVVASWEAIAGCNPTSTASLRGWTHRAARIDDAELLFAWRNDPDTRRHSRTSDLIPWKTHHDWLTRTLESTTRRLLVVEFEGEPIGTVRWDLQAPATWEVSITLAPQKRGLGYSARLLAAAERALGGERPLTLMAEIHTANEASRRLFASCGYLPDRPADDSGYLSLTKQLVREGPM